MLRPDGACGIHAQDGFVSKPSVCRRYPYSLVATPSGGRVSTVHRCPCRTLGDRAPLDVDAAKASPVGRDGSLVPDGTVEEPIPLSARTLSWFGTHVAVEEKILAKLARGEPALEALDRAPGLPLLERGVRWRSVADRWMSSASVAGLSGTALLWFGAAIRALDRDEPVDLTGLDARPWQGAFDRGELRGAATTAVAVLDDWIADVIWGTGWIALGPFDLARTELAELSTLRREWGEVVSAIERA